MALEREDRSLQAQIKQTLRDEIAAGIWRQGAKLPPEPELMKRFGVSRITVSQALRDLANDGLVMRRQGKGTFVSSNPQGWTNLGALLQRMPAQGHRIEHSPGQIELATPPADIAVDLKLGTEEQTWVITRIKQVGGAPAQWERAYIPASLITVPMQPGADEAWGHLLFIEILSEVTGQEARRCRAFLEAVVLNDSLAAATGEPPGQATIQITRLWHNALGQPVLLTRSVLRPDGTRYYVDLPDLPPKGRGEG